MCDMMQLDEKLSQKWVHLREDSATEEFLKWSATAAQQSSWQHRLTGELVD
jgi:hypothetical protein